MTEQPTLGEALAQLDPVNDEQWTTDGLPRVEAVAAILGREVKRAEINEAAPGFNREAVQPLTKTTDDAIDEAPPAQKEPTALEKLQAILATKREELTQIARDEKVLKERRQTLEIEISYLAGCYERAQGPDRGNNGVRAYLDGQAKLRQERADRMAAFKAHGVSDLLKTLGPSKLDATMNRRKPDLSSVRKEFPTSIAKD